MKNDPTKSDKVNLGLKLVIAFMFISGFLIFMYPFVVDAINNYADQQRLAEVEKEISQRNKQEKKAKIAEIKSKNEENKMNIPSVGSFEDPFEPALEGTKSPQKEYYEEHTLGAIFIPKINISLPVYDQTNDVLLEKGATILQGTSYPIGGNDSHSVITGHTGLPDKKLFTDLTHLAVDDTFYLHIEGIKLAYKIKKIKIVKPNKIDDLKVVEGEDLVTLLTCTPYGINSHRLLVTGYRVPYPENQAEKAIKRTQNYHRWRIWFLASICILFATLFLYFVWRKLVLYQSKKRNYNLVFFIKYHNQPIVDEIFQLYTHSGKKPVLVDGKVLQAISDLEGRVTFEKLPGGIYHIKAMSNFPKLKGKIWHLNDEQFRILAKRKYLTRQKYPNLRYIVECEGGRYAAAKTAKRN